MQPLSPPPILLDSKWRVGWAHDGYTMYVYGEGYACLPEASLHPIPSHPSIHPLRAHLPLRRGSSARCSAASSFRVAIPADRASLSPPPPPPQPGSLLPLTCRSCLVKGGSGSSEDEIQELCLSISPPPHPPSPKISVIVKDKNRNSRKSLFSKHRHQSHKQNMGNVPGMSLDYQALHHPLFPFLESS